MSSEPVKFTSSDGDDRDQVIPIRKSDILSALIRTEGLVAADDKDKFHQLCQLLGAIFHYEYFDRLEKLRDDYFYFNPEIPLDSRFGAPEIDRARLELVDTTEKVCGTRRGSE